MTPERKPVLWSCDDGDEELSHADMDEAINEHLDAIAPDELRGTLKVYGYAPLAIPANALYANDVLAGLLESLDEDYGDPNDESLPTPAMRIAAKALCDIILAEYKPWAHDVVQTVEVDVLEWVKENRPDWLEGEVRP